MIQHDGLSTLFGNEINEAGMVFSDLYTAHRIVMILNASSTLADLGYP